MDHISIEVENLSFSYDGEERVLKDITFCAEEKESIGIVGANGAGKSTLLKLLAGIEFNYSGSIRVEEVLMEKKTLPIIREKIGYVFSDSDDQLSMSTVYDYVASVHNNFGILRKEVEKRINNAINIAELSELRDQPIYKLSEGEKKALSLATVWSVNPEILLLDEPSLSLSTGCRNRFIKILNQYNNLRIIVSHDLDLILDTCRRTILINKGKIVADGDTAEILLNQKLLQENGMELPVCYSKIKNKSLVSTE